jgi:hypothetical protein
MELDILNKENLDSSITNEKYSGFNAINVPIKRGMYVCPKVVMSPYYEYEYSNYSGSLLINKANLLPKTNIGSTATPIPVSSPTVSGGLATGTFTAVAPIGSLNPNYNSGLSSPVSNLPFSPINPIGVNTTIASQSYTPTPLVIPTANTTSAPSNVNAPKANTPAAMPIMPMGGGVGGGVASPASEESNPEQAPIANAMKTVDVAKKGLSKETKIGLLVLVAIGGYYAYKKGLLGKI